MRGDGLIKHWEGRKLNAAAFSTSKTHRISCFPYLRPFWRLIFTICFNDNSFSCTGLLPSPPTITPSRPHDKGARVILVYMDGLDRLRLGVTQLPLFQSRSGCSLLMLRLRSVAKRIDRFIHAPAKEESRGLRLVRYTSCKLHDIVREVSKNCPLFTSSGHPLPFKKASISLVEERFNKDIQADFRLARDT